MPSEDPGPLRVLVADHDAEAADHLALLLTEFGYAVRIAYTGADALAMTASFWPDVAFVELRLPDVDGFEVAHHLTQTGRQRPLLVALTVLDGQEHRHQAHEAGYEFFITKPGRLDRFLQSLGKMCPGRVAGATGTSFAEAGPEPLVHARA